MQGQGRTWQEHQLGFKVNKDERRWPVILQRVTSGLTHRRRAAAAAACGATLSLSDSQLSPWKNDGCSYGRSLLKTSLTATVPSIICFHLCHLSGSTCHGTTSRQNDPPRCTLGRFPAFTQSHTPLVNLILSSPYYHKHSLYSTSSI